MTVPTFIVGTGRCGSTMLSNMLRDHKHVLSLSEFFALVTDLANSSEAFTPEPITGARFWSIVGGITPKLSFALRHRVPCPEWLYPCDAPSARFSRETGVPNILATTLPHLTEAHDHLFDLLQQEVTTWPSAPIAEHYCLLFGWLVRYFRKRTWIERSGGGLGFARQILTVFPDARFIHITRDGRDAALSMQNHATFVLGVAQVMLADYLGVDPFRSTDRSRIDRVPPELQPFLPERFELGALYSLEFALTLCGEIWSKWTIDGLNVLEALPPERVLTLRYEDFFFDAEQQLDRLTAFLGDEFVDHEWSVRNAATVHPPRSTWRDLPEIDIRALTKACEPGFERLRRAGVHYQRQPASSQCLGE